MARQRTVIPVTILNGQSLSAEVNVGAKRLVGVQMPAVWTAAGITFESLLSQTGGTPVFGAVLDRAGNELTLTAIPQNSYVLIDTGLALEALGRIKVRSGTLGAPVAQGAQRDFFLVLLDA